MFKEKCLKSYKQIITKKFNEKIYIDSINLNIACIKSNRTLKQIQKNFLKTLTSNIIYKVRDKNFNFIDDPQQRIYTVPRLE